MKTHNEVELLLGGHLHLKVFDALKLLCLPFDGKVLKITDEAPRLLHNRIGVGG